MVLNLLFALLAHLGEPFLTNFCNLNLNHLYQAPVKRFCLWNLPCGPTYTSWENHTGII